MKTLYLDIFSGISGDMFLGAMLDLGVDFHRLERELAKLGLDGYHLHAAPMTKAGIAGVKFDVHLAHEPHHGEAAHGHVHDHSHDDEAPHTRERSHGHAGSYHDHLEGLSHGPHGGPLVRTSNGAVELSVFEIGVPPRFRLYFFDTHGHEAKPPAASEVTLVTIRQGKKRQIFKFKSRPDYLEATAQLPEPHEFTAVLQLKHAGKTRKYETAFVEEHTHRHGRYDHDHDHSHGHGEAHDHSHEDCRDFADIKNLIDASRLSGWVKEKASAVFHRIAVAEGKVHGHPPDQVHFHEVGAVDSIVDIVGACVALEMLGKPRVVAAPVVEGTGWVSCAHGRFPVPTMATLEILGARGIPLTQCDEPHELVTPTGAALLAELVERFEPMRGLVAAKVGYGLGTRDNRTRPNVLRAVLGETTSSRGGSRSSPENDWEIDTVSVLETNLDDCTAEVLGYVVELALAEGALDVFYTPAQMKKNRPGVLLTILCETDQADHFSELLLRETSAFGVRRHVAERRKLQREVVTVKTAFGGVTVKIGKLNGKVLHVAPEFESCRERAQERKASLAEVYEAARRAFSKNV